MNQYIKNFYRSNNVNRSYGIYATGLNRFLLVDDLDVWIVVETANIISSKIPNIVYMLPYESDSINNLNCHEYGIQDISTQKMGDALLMFTTQTPILRTLQGDNVVIKQNNKIEIEDNFLFENILDYTNFVHLHAYAMNFTQMICKYEETDEFSKKYLGKDITSSFKSTIERSGLDESIFTKLRSILYYSSTKDEAKLKIEELWFNYSSAMPHVRNMYYKILQESQPEYFEKIPKPTNYSNYSG